MKDSYKVIRKFMNHSSKTLRKNLTLEEAQEHCDDPETSSRTCNNSAGKRRTRDHGPWFDCYDQQ